MKVNLNEIITEAIIANSTDAEQVQMRRKVAHYTKEGFSIDNYEMMNGKIAVNLIHPNGQKKSINSKSRF